MKRNADFGLRISDWRAGGHGTESGEQAAAELKARDDRRLEGNHSESAFRVPQSEIRNPQSAAPHSVELHIEDLVLHGFAPGDRYAIGDAVQRELERLLAEQSGSPLFSQSAERAHVDAGSFNIQPNAKPATIGTQIAAAVHGRMMR